MQAEAHEQGVPIRIGRTVPIAVPGVAPAHALLIQKVILLALSVTQLGLGHGQQVHGGILAPQVQPVHSLLPSGALPLLLALGAAPTLLQGLDLLIRQLQDREALLAVNVLLRRLLKAAGEDPPLGIALLRMGVALRQYRPLTGEDTALGAAVLRMGVGLCLLLSAGEDAAKGVALLRVDMAALALLLPAGERLLPFVAGLVVGVPSVSSRPQAKYTSSS